MDIKVIVASNLRRIKEHYHLTNRKMAERCGFGEGTIARALNHETALAIDTLQLIAKEFSLEPWMFLVPDLDPQNPYIICSITQEETEFYDRLRASLASAKS